MARIIFLFILLFSFSAHAQGLAMHGGPKYGPESTHLDYANPDAPKGGTITHGAIGTFDSLNPYAIKGKAAKGLNLFYDRLMGRVWDEPFTMYPLVAEKADLSEDRSEITFTINKAARFHDGSPITADDVIFSFETLRDHGRPNMRATYKLVDTIKKRDEYTVHFKLGEGHDQETAMVITLMPVLSKTYWQDKEFDSSTLDTPVSSGPYRIVEVDPGRKIVYERDPDYWGKDLFQKVGHHNFDRIVYEYYRDDTVAFEAFKAGDIDIRREVDAGRWAGAYDFPAITEGKAQKEALPHGRPERVNALIFNTRRAPFDDIRVRQAFDFLFDFDWANKNLFHGQYKQIESYFPNSELATPPSRQRIMTPRAKKREADRLLKEAGWLVEDGKRVKGNQTLSFEILLSSSDDEKLALHFKRALEQMGIAPTIRVLDAAAYRGRLNEYDFDMTLYYWQSSLSPGTEQILYWGCEAANQPARWNFPGICDPEIDALATSIAQTKTREDLITTVQKLDRKLLDGHYMIPLYYSGTDFIAYWDPITRPETTPVYGAVIETWWMDPNKP